MEFVNIYLI